MKVSFLLFLTLLGNQLFSQKLLYKLPTHRGDIQSIVFNSDNKTLAAGCDDNKIRIFKTNDSTGELLRDINAHDAQIKSIAFSKDGKLLVSGGADDLVKIWDSAFNSKVVFFGHGQTVNSVAIDPRNKFVYSVSADMTMKAWNVEKKEAKTVNLGAMANAVALNSTGVDIYVALKTINIKHIEFKTMTVKREFVGHKDEVNAVAVSPNGKLLVSGSSDKTAIVWDINTGKILQTLTGHKWKVMCVAISSNSKYAVTGSIDGKAILWDLETGAIVTTFDMGGLFVYSVAISNDMKKIAIAANKRNFDQTDPEDRNSVMVYESTIPGPVKPAPAADPKKKDPKDKNAPKGKATGKPEEPGKANGQQTADDARTTSDSTERAVKPTPVTPKKK